MAPYPGKSYPSYHCRSSRKSIPYFPHKICCVEKSGKEFVFVIDEWDALIREAKGDAAVQRKYLNLLRGWFKNNNFTPRVVAAAYMTGILPIKKDGSQSAISDFKEVTTLNPGRFVPHRRSYSAHLRAACSSSPHRR